MVPGYAPQEVTLWLVSLGMGVVVILVVITLLTFLIRLIQDIEGGILGVSDTLSRVAQNTAKTSLIAEVGAKVEAIMAEGLQHHLLLAGRLKVSRREQTSSQ